jgi:hypothetical protein
MSHVWWVKGGVIGDAFELQQEQGRILGGEV